MKTKSLYLAALLFVGATIVAPGKELPEANAMTVVAVKGSNVVKVIYKGTTNGKLRLNIYNGSAQIVYSEIRNSKEGFILPLNFSGLAAGEYTVEVIDASGARSEKISYQPAGSLSNVHIAKLAESGKFLLSVANDSHEDITVKIYDQENNLVHTSSKQVDGDFAQVFSIKNFTGVTFQVTTSKGSTKEVSF
ncbi:MAG: hypothetical protein WKF87_17245 [Chryseolinea sp.]